MMYSFITEHKPSSLSVKRACSTCSLSRSGYFKHLQNQKQPKKLLQTQEQVMKAFYLHKRLYGYRKVYAYLLNTSRGFRSRVEELGFVQSMSRKGNCYDNAYCECYFSLLKRELGHKVYESMEEAKEDIFEWIEGWYNTKRLHSALGYRSPVEFEKIMTNTS